MSPQSKSRKTRTIWGEVESVHTDIYITGERPGRARSWRLRSAYSRGHAAVCPR